MAGTTRVSQITSIRLHVSPLDRVRQVSSEHFVAEVPYQLRVTNRKHNFDPAVQVSRHQIGASQINLFLACISEVVNSAVLQEASHDTNYADVSLRAVLDSGVRKELVFTIGGCERLLQGNCKRKTRFGQ